MLGGNESLTRSNDLKITLLAQARCFKCCIPALDDSGRSVLFPSFPHPQPSGTTALSTQPLAFCHHHVWAFEFSKPPPSVRCARLCVRAPNLDSLISTAKKEKSFSKFDERCEEHVCEMWRGIFNTFVVFVECWFLDAAAAAAAAC